MSLKIIFMMELVRFVTLEAVNIRASLEKGSLTALAFMRLKEIPTVDSL